MFYSYGSSPVFLQENIRKENEKRNSLLMRSPQVGNKIIQTDNNENEIEGKKWGIKSVHWESKNTTRGVPYLPFQEWSKSGKQPIDSNIRYTGWSSI